jgi:hypothetical protein
VSQPEKPTELIYLPRSTAYPAVMAAGIAGVVVGLFTWWPYAVAGALVLLIALAGWLRDNRSSIAAMPNEQHTDTAPIPLRKS